MAAPPQVVQPEVPPQASQAIRRGFVHQNADETKYLPGPDVCRSFNLLSSIIRLYLSGYPPLQLLLYTEIPGHYHIRYWPFLFCSIPLVTPSDA